MYAVFYWQEHFSALQLRKKIIIAFHIETVFFRIKFKSLRPCVNVGIIPKATLLTDPRGSKNSQSCDPNTRILLTRRASGWANLMDDPVCKPFIHQSKKTFFKIKGISSYAKL